MRITERESSSRSNWSLRLALFAAQLILVTVLLHRFASLSTPAATNLIVVSLIGAATAFLLAILAFAQIWSKGIKGTGIALSGLIVSLLIFAVPLYHVPNLIKLPAINDITTDLLSPPQFRQIAALRNMGSNTVNYPGNLFISEQAKAYPDISTLMLERSNRDSYDLVHTVIQDLGWEIVSDRQPDNKLQVGIIEAVDHSQIMGFQDDIVVRVKGNKRFTRIDMRSASRYGRHDLGANAKRIRDVFSVIKTRIARAESNRIDTLIRRRLAKQSLAEKKKKERERKRLQKQKPVDQGPIILPKAQFDQIGVAPGETQPDIFSPSGKPRQARRSVGTPQSGLLPTARSRRAKKRKSRRYKKKRRRKTWIPFRWD